MYWNMLRKITSISSANPRRRGNDVAVVVFKLAAVGGGARKSNADNLISKEFRQNEIHLFNNVESNN